MQGGSSTNVQNTNDNLTTLGEESKITKIESPMAASSGKQDMMEGGEPEKPKTKT